MTLATIFRGDNRGEIESVEDEEEGDALEAEEGEEEDEHGDLEEGEEEDDKEDVEFGVRSLNIESEAEFVSAKEDVKVVIMREELEGRRKGAEDLDARAETFALSALPFIS